VNTLVAGMLFLPLALAVGTMLLAFRAGRTLTTVGIALQFPLALALWLAVAREGRFLYPLGGWAEPLGIALRFDGLAVTLVLLTTLVGGACGLHAGAYLNPDRRWQRYFWPLFWLLWAGLNGVWLAGDLFNLYVGLELVSLCAVGLVALDGRAQTTRAALRYLFAALLGSMLYLLGVALLYGEHGTLSLGILAVLAADANQLAQTLALGLMLAGLALKTALWPLHAWLPPAHGGAKSPVSALLSALVLKASFYIALRLWLDFGVVQDAAWVLAQVFGVLGTVAVFYGGYQACLQVRLKQVVAYSSVSQIGYLFLLFPLTFGVSSAVSAMAQQGVVLHLISHALAKAAMFLAAGNLVLAVRSSRVAALAGVSRFLPFSLFSFGLAGVSVMGLPPSGGFAAKWLLLQAALAAGQWWWLLTLLGGGLLSAAYVFRIYRASFVETGSDDHFYHPPRVLEALPMLLAVLALGLGLCAMLVLELAGLPVGVETVPR